MERIVRDEEDTVLPPPIEPMIPVAEAARILGVAQTTLYDWVRAGKVPHYKLGERVRFRASELDEWVTSRRVAAV